RKPTKESCSHAPKGPGSRTNRCLWARCRVDHLKSTGPCPLCFTVTWVSEMKKAVITGITGQDGSYLTEFLLSKGYNVYGFKRGSTRPRAAKCTATRQVRRASIRRSSHAALMRRPRSTRTG